MKKKYLLLVLLFTLLFSRQPLMSQVHEIDDLPVYNLFYLSKYLSSSNLVKKDSLKIYHSLVTLIRSSQSNTPIENEVINSFIQTQNNQYENNIKSIIENNTDKSSLIKVFPPTIKLDNFILTKIEKYYENQNHLTNKLSRLKSQVALLERVNRLLNIKISKKNSDETVLKEVIKELNDSNIDSLNYLNEDLSKQNIQKLKAHIRIYPQISKVRRDTLTLLIDAIFEISEKKFALIKEEDEKVNTFLKSLDDLRIYTPDDFVYNLEITKKLFTHYNQISESHKNVEVENSLKKLDSTLSESSGIMDNFILTYNALIDQFDLEQLGNKNTDKTKEIEEIIKKLKENAKELDAIVSTIFEQVKNNFGASESLKYLAFQYSSPTVQDIQINSVVYSAEQNATSSFKIPSESDLINGVTMFLAKRAKQEALIWFIDKLKADMHNPLMFDAFPNTYNLLRQSESFSQPHFGQTWRYALSKDLVKMPQTLLESPWVNDILANDGGKKEKVLRATEMVKICHEIFQLLHAQYNYRDILRYIYMNKLRLLDKESKSQNEIFTKFDFLYMVINELYNVDQQNNIPMYRMLTFEEISTLSKQQWEIFLELVKIKYNIPVYDLLKSYGPKIQNQISNNQSFQKLGSVLLTLSQFDKIRNSSTTETEDNTNTNLWGNLLRVVEQLDTSGNSKNTANNNNIIPYFRSTLSIYDYIYQRKFDLAAKETLDLVAKCLISTNKLIEYDLSIKKIKGDPEEKLDEFKRLIKEVKFHRLIKDSLRISYDNHNNLLINDSIVNLQIVKASLNYLNYVYNDKGNNKELWKIIRQKIINDKAVKNMVNAFLDEKNDKIEYENLPFQLFQNIKVIVDYLDYKNSSEPIPVQNIANTIESLTQENNMFNKYAKQLVKTTSFFSDIYHATDSKAIATAIDRHALPPTSYTLKRKVPFSITFNGYVGVYGGFQKINSTYSEYLYKNKSYNSVTYGLTAPVGFTFSKSNGGVFVQLIDVGNLVGHYLWRIDPAIERSQVTFKEVISPGINFMYYLPKSPFVMFAGIRGIPMDEKQVVKKDLNENIISSQNYNDAILDIIQFNMGIKIDIPIFNIYSKKY